jgi:hypothetical protein
MSPYVAVVARWPPLVRIAGDQHPVATTEVCEVTWRMAPMGPHCQCGRPGVPAGGSNADAGCSRLSIERLSSTFRRGSSCGSGPISQRRTGTRGGRSDPAQRWFSSFRNGIRYRTLRVGVASSTANATLNRPLRHHWGRRDFSAKADCARARGVAFSAVAGFLALSAALPLLEIQHPPKGLWPGVPYVRQTRQSGPSRSADAS